METGSNFPEDARKEQILSQYLDHVYEQIHIKSDRKTDKPNQFLGIDTIVTDRYNRKFKVDEKSQLDYLNKSLGTFAFEIGFLYTQGERKQGWLFDKRKETTHYMLVTDIYLKDDKPVLDEADDIYAVKLMWVNRGKLLAALLTLGIDQAYCEQAEQDARQQNRHGAVASELPYHYCYLTLTKPEMPFNLVIKREWLLQIGFDLI